LRKFRHCVSCDAAHANTYMKFQMLPRLKQTMRFNMAQSSSTFYELVQQVDGWPYLQNDAAGYRKHMEDYFYFMVEGYSHPFGYILKSKAEKISWPDPWTVDEERQAVVLSRGSGVEERSSFMENTLRSEHESGQVSDLRKLSKELYAVCNTEGELVLRMNRSAAGLFGIRTYGVFLVAFTETNEGRQFWVAQRSKTKMTHPGKLDMCVGGSLRADELPIDCLVREGEEEASIPAEFSRENVQPCGALTYHMAVDDNGGTASRAQTQYIYELELPMEPKPCDDEVEGFKLMNLEEIIDALRHDKFKPNIVMTWIDYLIRHGHMHAENEEKYLQICARLHRDLNFFVM